MVALVILGVASGLPYNLTRETLAAWMTQEKVELSTIGWFTLANAPATFKFLWSPFLDRFVPPFLGRRRGWMVITQAALVLTIGLMSLQRPRESLQLLAINAIVLAFLSATQDIAIDAYRADVLEEREVGLGVAVWVLGYRLALLVTGSVALIWVKYLSWQGVYLLLAALMALGLLVSIFAPEPEMRDRQGEAIAAPETLREAVQLPFIDFFQRLGVSRGTLILGFILLYKLGDYLAANMVTPFLLKTGFSLEEVGTIKGGVGLVATLGGGLVGGAVLSRVGINRSLWIFGGLQAVSNLAYFALALLGKNSLMMLVAVNIENFCGGLGTAAFLGFLMNLCDPRFSATQYALLSSLVAVSREIIASPAGKIAEVMGWPSFFFLTFCAAIPGLLVLPIFAPWTAAASPVSLDDRDRGNPDQR